MPTAEAAVRETHMARRRGEILRELGLMDERDEYEFDDLVELAAAICGKPIGALTLQDEDTQLLKARIGLQGGRTMPVRHSVCQHTVLGSDLFEIEDLAADDRFLDSIAFQQETGVRFYAGMPIMAIDGTPVGALCVMDTQPAQLSVSQRRALEILGRQASDQIRLRERARAVADMVAERDRGREMFATILNNVPVEIYLKDAAGHLRFYNRTLAERFGISDTEWLNKTSRDLWDTNTAEQIMREDASVMRHGKAHESFVEIDEKNGRHSYWKNTKVPCLSMNGELVLACSSVDITEQMERERRLQEMQDQLEEANRKLSSLALTDALTELWNRRAFDARLETSVIASHRSKRPMALVMVDVDNFKSTNDRFGHPYGDTVLRQIAKVIEKVKRAEDVACRFGGEEFTILLPDADADGARALCQRLLNAMHNFPWEKEPVTVSMGIAVCHATCTADDLVDAADAALYRAKREGKDRFVHDGCSTA